MAKNEVECQDCGNTLFDNSNEIKLCICYGEHRGEKIKVKLEKNNISSLLMYAQNLSK